MKHIEKVLLVLLALCSVAFANPDENKGEITEISLERTACLGLCPADEVVLRADGTASYIGKIGVPQIGAYTGRIPSYTFKMLAEYLVAQRFFDMENVSPGGPPETDGTFINVVRAGKVKTINFFYNAPIEQWGAAMTIRGVMSDIDWQQEKAGVNGILVSKAAKEDIRSLPKAAVKIYRYRGGHLLAWGQTDENGKFEMGLPPGTYFLTPAVRNPPHGYEVEGETQVFVVKPSTFTNLTVKYHPVK